MSERARERQDRQRDHEFYECGSWGFGGPRSNVNLCAEFLNTIWSDLDCASRIESTEQIPQQKALETGLLCQL